MSYLNILEIVTLSLGILAFLFILIAYLSSINTSTSKRIWTYFLLSSILIVLSRIFIRLGRIHSESLVGFFGHLSVLINAMLLLYATILVKESFER